MILRDRAQPLGPLAATLAAKTGRMCFGVRMTLTQDTELDIAVALTVKTGIPLQFCGLVAAIHHKTISIDGPDMAVWDHMQAIILRANAKSTAPLEAPLCKAEFFIGATLGVNGGGWFT